MPAACSPCADSDEGWGALNNVDEVEVRRATQVPQATFLQLQDDLRAEVARIHARLRREIQSDLGCIHARLEMVETKMSIEKPLPSADAEYQDTGKQRNKSSEPDFDQVNLQVVPDGGAADPQPTATDEFPGEVSEIHFEESVWSIAMVLGLVDAGFFDRLFAGILVLLNLVMQAAFSWVLFTAA